MVQGIHHQVKSKDSALLSLANKLKEIERVLDILVHDYSHYKTPGPLPPAPQEEQMRASLLYSFEDLDVGLPQTNEMEEKLVVESTSGPRLLIPSNVAVPSGWKPGMPVELPSDLPILPPLGDPPFDSMPEEQVRPTGLGRGLEPIQVRHVQLDIEDDSSDYSSDEESGD